MRAGCMICGEFLAQISGVFPKSGVRSGTDEIGELISASLDSVSQVNDRFHDGRFSERIGTMKKFGNLEILQLLVGRILGSVFVAVAE